MKLPSLLVVFAFAILTGCDNVSVQEPFGERLVAAEIDAFRGTWADSEGNIYYVERGSNSDLVVGITKWNSESESFTTQSIPMSIRRCGEKTLLYFPFDTRSDDRFAFVWLSSVTADSICARQCDAKAFRRLVESGDLTGTITKRKNDHFDVHLGSDTDLADRVSGNGGSELFEPQVDNPLRRITPHKGG